MDKEFLPYQQALELKELGFDKPCFGCYFHNNENVVEYNPDGIPFNHNNSKTRISAPTFSQIFRFFREKYQASPSIHCMSEQGNSWRYHIPNEGGETDFLTYEDAELACLIKLIQIVKDGKVQTN